MVFSGDDDMSGVIQRSQEIGWRYQPTVNVDPIVDTDEDINEFGEMTQSWGKFPILETEILASRNGTTYDAASHNVANTKVIGIIGFNAYNGLPFYMMNCRHESGTGMNDGGVNAAAEVYTITPITSGELDVYTIRYHSDNASARIRKSITDCKFNSLSMTLDLTQGRLPLNYTMGFQGGLMSPIQPDTNDYSMIHPDSLEKLFFWDQSVNSIFEFDSVDLSDLLLNFNYTQTNLNQQSWIKNQHYPKYTITSDRIHTVTFTLERRDNTDVFDDYMAQAGQSAEPDDDFKDLKFKIRNANSKYIQTTFGEVAITKISMNNAIIEKKEIPTYEIVATPRTIAPVIKDGITTLDYYGLGV